MRLISQGLHAGWAAALDAILPPRCLCCGATIGRGGELCQDCWPLVTQLAPPQCESCGAPFPHDQGQGARCGACLGDPPPFARARAAFLYDEGSRGLVLGFKHADRLEAAPAFARWMARAGQELLADCDALVPVPLHWRRLFKRRYNQAALLALHLGRLAEKPTFSEALKRIKATPPQGYLSPQARAANIAGAFKVPKGQRGKIEGKRLLLIDDVLTTGATARLATRVLLKAGAAKVDVLTLALVPRLSA